jgi:hypothetical protein
MGMHMSDPNRPEEANLLHHQLALQQAQAQFGGSKHSNVATSKFGHKS